MSAVPYVPAAAIREALHLSWAMSDDDTRLGLCGINLRTRDGHLVAIASNGVVLARLAIPLQRRVAAGDVTLAGESINTLARILADESDHIALKRQSAGPLAGMCLHTDFPDAEKIDAFFSKHAGTVSATVRRKPLLASLRKLRRFDMRTRIRTRAFSLDIREGDDKPRSIACAANCSGPGSMFIDRRFLIPALSWLRGEFVTVHFGATKESKFETPVILFGHGDGSRAVAIMELRP